MPNPTEQGSADILGLLPGPALKANGGACDLLYGEVFAYAVSGSIAVVDVRRMQLACVLQGPHRSSVVTAVSWCSECHSRDMKGGNALRMASGDQEGRVVVWDIATGTPVISLEDPVQAAGGARSKGGAVKGLAWVMANPARLAIVLAGGMVLVWDVQGNTCLWKKDFGPEAALCAVKVDPSDARRLCLAGQKGSLIVLRLTGMARDRVEQQTYKVDMSASKPGDALRAVFSLTRDLLYVLLPREVVVFDLEYGQPAASTTLPSSRPAFRDLLGCFGHADAGKQVLESGVDLLYTSHQDGSVSVWRRTPNQLTYSLLGLHKLVPPPSRVNNNATISLLCAAASAWVRCDVDPKHEEDDEEEAILPMLDSLPPDCVGAKARVLMAKGRKLSTIYSKVSAISGASTVNSSQAGDDPTGWTQTSARLRASLLPDQLLAEGDGEGSDAGTGQDAQQAADSQQESSAESAAGAAHKGASSERADEKERELQEPEVAENGFLARLSGLSGQSSGHSSGSDSRSLTGQPSGHSSMHSIPEGSEAPADPSSSHLTSYAVRLSPAQTHSSSQLSPRSSGPAQTWSGAGDGGQWQLGDSLLSSSPARGGGLRKQSSLKKPPRPPSMSPAKAQRSLDVRFQERSLDPPSAPPSVFSAASSSKGTVPWNSLEERIMSGTFSSPAATPRLHGDQAQPSMPTPVSAFEAGLSSHSGPRPIPLQMSPPRQPPPWGLPRRQDEPEEDSGCIGPLYTPAQPVAEVTPPVKTLLMMTVSEEGYVWQWDMPLQSLFDDETSAPAFPPAPTMMPTAFSITVPSKTANAAAPAATGTTKPHLLGLLQTLPHSVTTFSVCPSAVGVGMLGLPGGPPSASSGRGGDAVALLAAVTAAGNVEFVTLQRGAVCPLMGTVSVSLGAHKDVVRGVRWLGPSARVVSFSSEKTAHGYRNTLLITDVRSRASLPFREVGPEAAPMLGIRASASGRYLLILLRGAPSEIWALGGSMKPSRIRVLDLPFTAVEWVLPEELTPAQFLGKDKWMVWERSPLARERSLFGYWDDADEGQLAAAAMGGSEREGSEAQHSSSGGAEAASSGLAERMMHAAGAHGNAEGGAAAASPGDISDPEERLAFALSDGRVGVLAVKGRKVTDTKPKRPSWGLMSSSSEGVATAIAAWGHFVIMGDTEGSLNRWDTQTGRISTVQTTQGPVRRIHFAPPAAEDLVKGAGNPCSRGNARVSVLFANGTFGIWELDARNELQQGPVTVAASAKLGKVIDLAWVPLPAPIGGGSVVVVAGEDGSLAVVDATQTVEARSLKKRLAAFKNLVGGRWPFPQGGLSPPSALGSSLLLPRPWAALLRLLLQQKVPAQTLKKLAGPVILGEEDALEEVVWACLPKITRDIWQQTPHRMYSAEAEELSLLAGNKLQRHASQDLNGMAQFANTVSADSKDDEAGWDASFNTFPMATSMPMPIRTVSQQAALWDARSPAKTLKASSLSERIRAGTLARSVGLGIPVEAALPASEAITAEQAQPPLAPQKQYAANMGSVIRALTRSRANGQLLHDSEWRAYEEAIASGSTAARMAVMASVAGDPEEVAFWRGLPATLAALKRELPPAIKARIQAGALQPTELESGILKAFSLGTSPSGLSMNSSPFAAKLGIGPRDAPHQSQGVELSRTTSLRHYGAIKDAESADVEDHQLWSATKELAEARERMLWHEHMSRRNIDNSEALQERRVIEYVSLGDFQTAVGFLLASTPEKSIRYYRDALCTLALAAASSEPYVEVKTGNHEMVSRTLHIQAAKVVAAHAASVGDALLGVPLLCSAGLPQEGVAALQEAGLWRYAATLTAHTLKGDERAAALERWAAHVHQYEGNVWRALGIMAAAGGLRNAALLLRELRMPDAAAAFCAACKEAGFHSAYVPADAGGLENLLHHTGNTPPGRSSCDLDDVQGHPQNNTVEADYLDYCCSVLQHL